MWLKDEAAAKGWFLAIVRREYPRTFERKRFITVDVDDFLTREEPMLAAAEEQNIAEPPQRDHRVDNNAGNPCGFARSLDLAGDRCSAFAAFSIMLPRVLMQ